MKTEKRIRSFVPDSGSLRQDMNKELSEWDHRVSGNILNKRLGNKSAMPKMGLGSVGLEGEPSGTPGKYTVKDRKDGKRWRILVFSYSKKTARR